MPGRLQNEDIKSVAELAAQGCGPEKLPNDDKVYITANTINKTLKQAIIDGDLSGGGGAAAYTQSNVAQVAHGFAVKDWVYHNGTQYVKAKADLDSTSEVVGMVLSVTDADNFVLAHVGYVTGLSGLTAGATYYLSPTTAGGMTTTEPTTAGHVSKPVFVAISTTAGFIIQSRGYVVNQISGTTANTTARFVLEAAVIPYISINGPHYVSNVTNLSVVNISALGTGTSGSTQIRINQYRAGALLASATASLAANAGLPGGTAAALSQTLNLAQGDIITVDVVTAADGASDLCVEWEVGAGPTGSQVLSIVEKTASYTLVTSDDIVIFNSPTDVVATLPSAAAVALLGKKLTIKNEGAGAISVERSGADTIEGDTSFVIAGGGSPGGSYDFAPHGGTKWSVL